MQLLHFMIGLALLSLCHCMSTDDRVVGWNKAHGLWGKRSMSMDDSIDQQQNKRTAQNWNKLNSLWGKRSIPMEFDEMSALYKRSPNAQWQRANGLWGR